MTDTPLARHLRALPLFTRANSTREADRPTSRPIYASETDEHPQMLDLPGPRTLAERALLPALAESGVRVRRGPSGTLYLLREGAEPVEVTTSWLAADLRRALAALPTPSREDGDTLAALHTLATRARPRDFTSYALRVAEQARLRSTPLVTAGGPRKPRAKGAPPAERAAKSRAARRERERAEELATAREWFPLWLASDGVPEAISPPALYALYVSDYEGEPVAGSRTFYGVAAEFLGPKRRASGGRSEVFLTADARRALGIDGETLADLFAEEYVPADEARRRSA